MALREFTHDRLTWRVWHVRPTQAAVRASEGATGVTPPSWLAFECIETRERRRLTPAPEGWELLDHDALGRLCDEADRVGIRRRLIE